MTKYDFDKVNIIDISEAFMLFIVKLIKTVFIECKYQCSRPQRQEIFRDLHVRVSSMVMIENPQYLPYANIRHESSITT